MFLPGFATLPPIDRDEGRYVVSSQRMAETGDFIDIRYQDTPRYLQPAGIYWLQSIATIVFDSPAHDSVWSYRVPSLLAAIIAALLTGAITTRYFGRKAGIAAGLLLVACLSLNFEARIAKTDAALLASIVTAQFALMRLYTDAEAKRWVAALFWAALGVGLMIKGPIILIVIGATIAALLAWERKFAWLTRLRPLWGPLIMLAIALPWYVAIGIVSDGEFYQRAVGQSMMDKVGNSQQGHSGLPGYHLALFALMFWPGSLLIVGAAIAAWRRRAEPSVRFLICWIVPTWIVFELVATKLPHYVLPTYPAIACLSAMALFDAEPGRGWASRAALSVWSLMWLAATLVIAGIGPAALNEFEGGVGPLALSLAGAVAVAGIASLWFVWRREAARAVAALAIAGAFGAANIFAVSAPGLDTLFLSPRIAALARAERPCPDSTLVTSPYNEPSLVFLYGREATVLATSGADAADRYREAGTCALALVGSAEEEAFLARAGDLGLSVAPVGELAGRNYSNGDDLTLTLYVGQRARDAGN
jgi:4-amino-4-deoxy-L-arabinose transferase-like glycosyltransferase